MAQRVGGRFEKSARVTPANGITMLRLLGSPVIVILIAVLGVSWVTVVVWVALASTDFVDGWVARRQGATDSGAFLDPLADKFLVLGALGALAAVHHTPWTPVAIIAGRELAISAYRSVVARRGISVPARPLAKAKTAAQDLAVTLLVLPGVGDRHPWLGQDVLWAAVGLALVSGAQYLLDARRRPA
ncbi:MAG: CDP-alcohol phosphatidyltransferase family protein [Acidimicrobiales bacterium]